MCAYETAAQCLLFTSVAAGIRSQGDLAHFNEKLQHTDFHTSLVCTCVRMCVSDVSAMSMLDRKNLLLSKN